MGDRGFLAVVAAGLLAVATLGWFQATRADRVRRRALASGHAYAELAVREMG